MERRKCDEVARVGDDDGADLGTLCRAQRRSCGRHKQRETDDTQRQRDTRFPIDSPIRRIRRRPARDDGEAYLMQIALLVCGNDGCKRMQHLQTIRLPDVFDVADVPAGRAHVDIEARDRCVRPGLCGDRIVEPERRRKLRRLIGCHGHRRPGFAQKG